MTRFIIYGAGAIGATLGAALHRSGRDVVLIARGAHYDALASSGLVFETPESTERLRIPVVDHPSRLTFDGGDRVMLAMKGQDTLGALTSLAAVADRSTPVVCAQNGVENERLALRFFSDVHAMCVICPATHLAPGVVSANANASPVLGAFDLGRFPAGLNSVDETLATALVDSRCESVARPDAMAWKYAKLLRNLGNAVEALFGRSRDRDDSGIAERARHEADACVRAAGITFVDEDTFSARHDNVVRPSAQLEPGRAPRQGSSTWQSLARGTRSVETDYLNGEISLLGRLHGVATPVNDLLQELVAELARRGGDPGTLTAADFAERLDARSPSVARP